MATSETDYPEHIKTTAVEWRLLVLDGELSPKEQQAFDCWLSEDVRHAEAYEHAAVIWAALGTIRPEGLEPALCDTRAHGAVQRILSTLEAGNFFERRSMISATAAVIGVGVLALFAWERDVTDVVPAPVITAYETKKGETRSVMLSDATAVTLGADSALRVTMSGTKRRVELSRGAAAFDVSANPERPFVVEAQSLTVTVTGTVFDVRNNGDVVRLSVAEGVVEASHPWMIANAPTHLVTRRQVTAGQRLTATTDQGLSNVESFRVQNFATWRDDRLRYAGATLKELIADANRYSAREIVLDGLTSELESARVAVSFSGQDIDSLLATLPDMFAVEVARADDGTILIRQKTP